jgi:sugar phosphate isomerase/epimerase
LTGQTQKRVRRGTVGGRWGFDGVYQIVAPQWAEDDLQAVARLLPRCRAPVETIVAELLNIGGRYHRYLHQDEFGPTRAERMAALREILDRLEKLGAQLGDVPANLRSTLYENQTIPTAGPPATDLLESYLADQAAIELLFEAATDVDRAMARTGMAAEVETVTDIRDTVETTLLLLRGLDSTTEAEVVIDAGSASLLSMKAEAVDPFAFIRAQVDRLHHRFEVALSNLEHRKGPEPRLSLGLFFCQLCDLWCRETGKPITATPVRQGIYIGRPQSAAGRFVLAAVEALQPPPSWIKKHELAGAHVRATIMTGHPEVRAHAVHSAMRVYVASQSAGSMPRRGRPRRK